MVSAQVGRSEAIPSFERREFESCARHPGCKYLSITYAMPIRGFFRSFLCFGPDIKRKIRLII